MNVSFLKHHLGAATPENPEIELLRLELAEMKEKYEAIVEENKKLKAKVMLLKNLLKDHFSFNDLLVDVGEGEGGGSITTTEPN